MSGRPIAVPRCLLIDLDDTVLDWSGRDPSIDAACGATAARYPALDAEALRRSYAESWSGYRPEVEPLCWTGQASGFAAQDETWRRTLAPFAAVLDDVAECAAAASATHRQLAREAHRLYPDAVVLLAAAADAGIRVGLVTNGPSDVQRDKMAAIDVVDAFAVVVISGEVGVAKPDPAIFEHALTQVGVAPEETWHVGDSLTHDVAGAAAAGLVTVWLNRSGRALRPDATAPDLIVADLVALVEHLG